MLGLASSSALYSGLVPALGLGEITLHSALNQPLEADIELLEIADLSADDLKVRLAPAEVFSRSGVERFYFLNDLRFTPLLRDGSGIIRVRSNQPVREPYLNFIVEVARPNGRLLREYTLLLDPPGSSAYRTLTSAPAASAGARARVATPPAAPRTAGPKPPAILDKRYRVVRGDSLWKIAARLRAEGSQARQQDLMADIHALNPQAFAGGDINQLLASVELLLPDSAVSSVQAEAAAVAAEQTADAKTLVSNESPAPQPIDPQVELITQAQRRVEQELAGQAAENLQLQQQLAEVQAQIQQLQAQMESKDQQLAALQARLREGQGVADTPAGQAAESTAPALSEQAQDEPAAIQGRNWFGAGVAALLLVLASLAGLLWRSNRRRAQLEALQPEPEPEPRVMAAVEEEAPAPLVQPPKAAAVEPEIRLTGAAPARQAAPADALEGANIYIAYGRFGAAADALRKALDAQPERNDIRFRLLEVLAQLGDVQAFAQEEALFREGGSSSSRVDELKARYPQMSERPASEPLDDAVLVFEDQEPQGMEIAAEEDFQLNLDDLSLDADWDLVTAFESPSSKKSAAPGEAGDAAPGKGLKDSQDVRSPFAETMLVEEASAEDWLQEEVAEEFSRQDSVDDGPLLVGLDQLEGDRDNLTKLNLALAYIEQGSLDSACGILNQVLSEGDEVQKQQARELLAKIA